jgi:NADPH-dependent 2,4-dienoyl-CoA reductase/sulfur reductase-like enzyme
MPDRRRFLATAAATLLVGCASLRSEARPRVVVIGGGYGGATAARYLAMWSSGGIDVTLVEREQEFVSCPLSNLVLGGSATLGDLTRPYAGLAQRGVKLVRDEAAGVDAAKRVVRLRSGAVLQYDRLVLSPGVDMVYDTIPGLATPEAQEKAPHAWRAGPQTLALRRQLEAMRDGGVFLMHIPLAPFRCPPAPYERVCQVAHYLRAVKPRCKILVFDANEEVLSKKDIFLAAWRDLYPGMVEYRPNSELVDVDAAALTAHFDFEEARGDVLNIIPPQRAGAIAINLDLANANGKFCSIDFLTYESTAQEHVHLLGDAIQPASLMPKSGHMANQHGKVCAAAIIALLAGREPNPEPVIANACYSFVDDKRAAHIASVHRYDAREKTMLVVPGTGGVSPRANELEGRYARSWAANIWADMLT